MVLGFWKQDWSLIVGQASHQNRKQYVVEYHADRIISKLQVSLWAMLLYYLGQEMNFV
jgi:hypothetical protein